MARVDAAAGVSPLWLETLQRLADRAAHEIKGALNGVALNVEVARSRSTKPGAQAAAVAPYASAAQQQLEVLTAQTEALLALARSPRGPADVGALVARLADLGSPIARSSGGELRLGPAMGERDGVVGVPVETVRLALAAALLAALEVPGRVAIDVSVDEMVRVSFRHEDGATVRLRADVSSVLADAGVQTEELSDGVRLAFAARGDADTGET